jgi:WhiB family redox-sensing transcriptional regulator
MGVGELPELVLDSPPWMADAACAGQDTRRWFDGGGTVEARAVCRACLVRVECLDYALADPHLAGTWGGLREIQRRQLRRRRRAA